MDDVAESFIDGTDVTVDVTTDAILGALGEAAETVTGASDMAMAGPGVIASVIVGECLESFLVNRPAYREVTRIRNAAMAGDQERIKREITDVIGGTDSRKIERVLTKVHKHYRSRVENRLNKLKSDSVVQGRGSMGRITCLDAVRLTRYILKVHRLLEKSYGSIVFLESVVNTYQKKLLEEFPGLNPNA